MENPRNIGRNLAVLFALCTSMLACSHTPVALNMDQIQTQLGTTGVEGWVHGAVGDRDLYVFTVRNPDNFFDYAILSLVSHDPAITKQLAQLHRHDLVRIKGSFMADNPSPQKHVLLSSLERVKSYHSSYPVDPYEHHTRIPAALRGKKSATFLVHAVGGNGHILVTEYGDAILPFYVHNGKLTQGLYRGDLVQLRFLVQDWPFQPIHLLLDESAPTPVKVLDSIHAKNGKPATLEGALILFPKSPEILWNVFAVQEVLPAGLTRQYTLVDFDDPKIFTLIRRKLQRAWDERPHAYVNGRNKLVSTRIRVKATGVFNDVDPGQANPQILLKSADAVQIEEAKLNQ